MRKIDGLLGAALGRQEVLRAAKAQRLLRQWPEIVGGELAKRSTPDRYDRGTVWVAVEGSAWAQELRMIKERLLKRLNELAGEPDLFTEVRFGVRTARGDGLLPLEEPAAPVEKTSHHTSLSIREIAEKRLEQWTRENRDSG